jgi:hypothetical protein
MMETPMTRATKTTPRAATTALALIAVYGALAACAPSYTLIAARPAAVARNTIKVTPGIAWNKAPKGPFDIAWEETWTANGALLDRVTFIGGLPDGQAITKQRPKADRQVPVFRATMSPQDLVAMIETYHRLRDGATVFEATGVAPVTFIGVPGLAFDYSYTGADEVKRRGRTVLAINDGRLYMMALDGAAIHYFDTALVDFSAMAASARL